MNAHTEANHEPREEFNAIEAEQALLGAVLTNNEAYALVSDRVEPIHFFEPLHARLWEAIATEVTSGRHASIFTLAPRFRDDATMQGLGGLTYITALQRNVVTVLNAAGYADKILEAYRIREGHKLAAGLAEAIANDEMQEANEIRKALSDLFDTGRSRSADKVHIGAVTDSVITELNDVLVSGRKPEDGAYCGSVTLAQELGSWKRGCLYVLAGRPSMGKTTVGLSLMLRTAKKHNVLFFSLEMSREQLAKRALSDLSFSRTTRIEYQSIGKFEVTPYQMEPLIGAHRQLETLRLQIDERPGLKVEQIRAAAAKEKMRLEANGERLDVICVDHMGIMGVSDRYKGNPVYELAEISGGLKVMAKELDCAVVALMQLNRSVESRESKRPALSDIRGSGAIEQDADVVMFIYREAYYLERAKFDDAIEEEERQNKLREVRHLVELDIAKNRHGACRRLDFFCDMGCSALRDWDAPR